MHSALKNIIAGGLLSAALGAGTLDGVIDQVIAANQQARVIGARGTRRCRPVIM